MGIFDKAKDALGDHGDKVDAHIDRAGELADDKTGGKYTSHIDKGEDFASEKVTDFLNPDADPATDAMPPAPGPR